MAAAVVSLFYPGVLSLLKMFELIVEDAPAMFRDGVVLIFGSMLYFALGTLWAWCAVSIRGKREGWQHIAVTAIHGITLVVLSLCSCFRNFSRLDSFSFSEPLLP